MNRYHLNLLLMLCAGALSSVPVGAHGEDIDDVQVFRFEPRDKSRSRVVPVKVYLRGSGKQQPVILFSHGLGGSRENNVYLGQHWAAAGYVAVFMQHAGSDEEVWKSAKRSERRNALQAATGAKSLLDRLADVSFVIDQLEVWNRESSHPLRGKLDLEHLGMSGHSYGAATTMGVAGRKYNRDRSFPDERIDAFLAMSPQSSRRYSSKKAFGHLSKPILCMTGTKDGSPLDPTLKPESRLEVYSAMPKGDKYQLLLKDAQHSAFGDSAGKARRRNPKHHPAIQKISVHFWNAYLKESAESKSWLRSQAPIKETGLSDADNWKWK